MLTIDILFWRPGFPFNWDYRGASQNQGYSLGVPIVRNYSILRPILGFGKLPYRDIGFRVFPNNESQP